MSENNSSDSELEEVADKFVKFAGNYYDKGCFSVVEYKGQRYATIRQTMGVRNDRVLVRLIKIQPQPLPHNRLVDLLIERATPPKVLMADSVVEFSSNFYASMRNNNLTNFLSEDYSYLNDINPHFQAI